MSSLQHNWRKGQNKFCLEVRGVGGGRRGGGQGREMTQIMYAHVNICIKKNRFRNDEMLINVAFKFNIKVCSDGTVRASS
jgi:hypothetical protein